MDVRTLRAIRPRSLPRRPGRCAWCEQPLRAFAWACALRRPTAAARR